MSVAGSTTVGRRMQCERAYAGAADCGGDSSVRFGILLWLVGRFSFRKILEPRPAFHELLNPHFTPGYSNASTVM